MRRSAREFVVSDYSLFTCPRLAGAIDYSLSLLTYRIRQIIPNRQQKDFYKFMDVPIGL